jgi:type III secretory pathway component EscU
MLLYIILILLSIGSIYLLSRSIDSKCIIIFFATSLILLAALGISHIDAFIFVSVQDYKYEKCKILNEIKDKHESFQYEIDEYNSDVKKYKKWNKNIFLKDLVDDKIEKAQIIE